MGEKESTLGGGFLGLGMMVEYMMFLLRFVFATATAAALGFAAAAVVDGYYETVSGLAGYNSDFYVVYLTVEREREREMEEE